MDKFRISGFTRAACLAATCLAALAASGCATVYSQRAPSTPQARAGRGINYFLPKRLVKLTVTRAAPDATALINKRDGKVPGRDAAKVVFADASAKKTEAETKQKAFKPGGTDAAADAKKKGDLDTAVKDATTKFDEAKITLDAAQADLDKLRDEIAAAQNSSDCSYQAKLELLPVQADAAYGFVADYFHNPVRDDHDALVVASTGLLTSANVVATDHTGDIIVEAAGALAVMRAGLPGALANGDRSASKPVSCAKLPAQFVRIFDPIAEQGPLPAVAPAPPPAKTAAAGVARDAAALREGQPATAPKPGPAPTKPAAQAPARPSDDDALPPANAGGGAGDDDAPAALVCNGLQGVNVDLCESGFPIRIRIDSSPLARLSNDIGSGALPQSAQGASSGIYYRSPIPVVLTLEQQQIGGRWQPIDAAIVTLPQAGPISYIPMQAGAFVKTTSDVTFVDGTVASWTRERPSEVLEVVRLPVRVATQAINAVSGIVKLRFDYFTQSKSLVDNRGSLETSQIAEIKTAEALKKLQACVHDAETTGAPVDKCFP